jgi:hypothetical protein
MKVPNWIVPALVVALALAGLGGAKLFAIPSLELEFQDTGLEAGSRTDTVELLVDGVRCVDTARRAASTLEDLPGVYRFVAYASRNRLEISYDPELLEIDQLVESLEGPVYDEESGEFLFHLFEVIEIDGRPVSE